MKILAILITIITVTSIFTGISQSEEPHSWIPSTRIFYNYQEVCKDINSTPGPDFLTTYNLSGSGGEFTLALGGNTYGPASGTPPPNCCAVGIPIFCFWVSIISENLSFPFNTMSLNINNDSLSSSGHMLMSVSSYNDSNILTIIPYLGGYFGTNPNGSLHMNTNSINSPITGFQMDYTIPTRFNYTTVHEHYLRVGNFSMNFTLHFTPAFEIGPYFEVGSPMSISLEWRWTILPYCTP